MTNYLFRQAEPADAPIIWTILQDAIRRRAAEGSQQWQDGYPNPEVIANDIAKGAGFLLDHDGEIVAYVALFINDEPAYRDIVGKWLSDGDFVAFHRIAIASAWLGKGISKILMTSIEEFARQRGIDSIKADTNFDNAAMLAIFSKLGYVHCGDVQFRGGSRMAFEKVL